VPSRGSRPAARRSRVALPRRSVTPERQRPAAPLQHTAFPLRAVTGLGPEQPTSRLYSTNESVMRRSRFRPYASYPSMGFGPLQGPPPSRRASGEPEDRSRGPDDMQSTTQVVRSRRASSLCRLATARPKSSCEPRERRSASWPDEQRTAHPAPAESVRVGEFAVCSSLNQPKLVDARQVPRTFMGFFTSKNARGHSPR